MNEQSEIAKTSQNTKILAAGLCLAVALIYFFSNPKPQNFYDYTFRVADNVLRGSIAFKEKPPSWLNEFVPFEGNWYSVFPLGSVVTMIPFALLKVFGLIGEMPAAYISALTAGFICLFLFLIARRYDYGLDKQILLTLSILFGTWMWVNETMAGAWQLALGFAMLGELGAIYFTVFNRKPFLAGLFFALAFGNRTEVLLVAPIFMFLLFYSPKSQVSGLKSEASDEHEINATPKKKKHKKRGKNSETESDNQSVFQNFKAEILNLKSKIFQNPQSAFRTLATFCAVPFVLGVSTLIYNYIRFYSFSDFGYARIPGVLDEPWYNHGIFSYHYIPGQAWEMLCKPWELRDAFPYLVPNGFSSSILWSSPFLFLLLRINAKNKTLKYLSWISIVLLSILLLIKFEFWVLIKSEYRYIMFLLFWILILLEDDEIYSNDKILKFVSWIAIIPMLIVLWMHGNSGGWQFGYRYAMVLLPFLFVILLENSPKKITPLEWAAYGLSFLINAYAVYLFHWSEYMKV